MANKQNSKITVDRLEIHFFVSHERDPYGQDGFSSRTARIQTWDKQIISALKRARSDRSEVVVECSNMEVQGQVFKCTWGFRGFKAVISADEIRFMKPA